MTRPLMQHSVGQLQELFTMSKADAKVLKQLEKELQYRQVPRAVALLAEVQAAMYESSPLATPVTVSISTPGREPAPVIGSRQPDLWGRPSAPLVVAPPIRAVPPTAKPLEPPLVAKPEILAPAMPLDDAYKVLKATPGATWESIEQTRSTLVLQSHPSRWKSLSTEKRAQALAESKRVNAAYAALSKARGGGR